MTHDQTRANLHDGYHAWGIMGQLDEQTFVYRVVNRRTDRQRRVIIKRSSDGKAAIVEMTRWGMEQQRLPAGFKKAWLKPPPIMAAERLRVYGLVG